MRWQKGVKIPDKNLVSGADAYPSQPVMQSPQAPPPRRAQIS